MLLWDTPSISFALSLQQGESLYEIQGPRWLDCALLGLILLALKKHHIINLPAESPISPFFTHGHDPVYADSAIAVYPAHIQGIEPAKNGFP